MSSDLDQGGNTSAQAYTCLHSLGVVQGSFGVDDGAKA